MTKKAAARSARVAKPSRVTKSNPELSGAQLTEMIEAATVDAYNEAEQATGWFTMFEEHLDLPFETEVLGVRVKVSRIDLRDDDRIVAICTKGKARQEIDVAYLPLPTPPPEGWDWLVAYARWREGQ